MRNWKHVYMNTVEPPRKGHVGTNIQVVCPLYRGCPLLRGSNHIILIGRDKFVDLVLSFVERYLIQCPFLGGSSLRGSTVYRNMEMIVYAGYLCSKVTY